VRQGRSTIVIAHSLVEANDIIQNLMLAYGLSLPVVLLMAAAGGWWVSGRALRPLRALTAAAESVRPDLPEWRVPVDPAGARDELRRLADVLNDMLTRLERSFQQSQRFAADASHELRTPLTIMHGEIERLVQVPGTDPAVAEKLVSLQEEILRLDLITEHLLLLARFDSGAAVMQRERVNLSKLITSACEDVELLSSAQRITLRTVVPPDIFVEGDAAHLRRALLALLDNAVRYNQPEGEISCALDVDGPQAAIHIRNTGPGIPAEARAQLFQRFFRVDQARTRGGHGLGLSLAREIARAHRGDVTLAEGDREHTEFVLTLPLAR
jgi:signal transduction histidine kinase